MLVAARGPKALCASSRLHLPEGGLQHSTRWQCRVLLTSCRLETSCVLSSLHAGARRMHGNKGRD